MGYLVGAGLFAYFVVYLINQVCIHERKNTVCKINVETYHKEKVGLQNKYSGLVPAVNSSGQPYTRQQQLIDNTGIYSTGYFNDIKQLKQDIGLID